MSVALPRRQALPEAGAPGRGAVRLAVVPPRVCSFSCIHCPHGRTLTRTAARAAWEAPDRIVARAEQELRAARPSMPEPELALAGGGEPTLHSGLGEIVEKLHGSSLPVAVHTNGSLLWLPEVQDDLQRADRVVVCVAAGERRLFEHVHRPPPELGFERVVEGWRSFRRNFLGRVEVEVVLLGITAVDEDVRDTAAAVAALGPDLVFLRTCTEVTAEPYALPVQPATLERFAPLFAPRAQVTPPPERPR